MEKVAIVLVTRKVTARFGAPSTRSDQTLELGKISLIDLAHFARQFRTVKPLFGLSLLQSEKIQQSHPRPHGGFSFVGRLYWKSALRDDKRRAYGIYAVDC